MTTDKLKIIYDYIKGIEFTQEEAEELYSRISFRIKNMKQEITKIILTERYRLIGPKRRIMSSDDEKKVKTFFENMKNSGRFLKKDIDRMVIIDALSLGKAS